MIRNIIFGVYLDFQIFWRKVSKPTKTSKKDKLSHNTVSLRKPCPFYKPQFTQHCKHYTPATHPITLLTFQIFQTKCFSVVSEKKTFALNHFQKSTNYILKALGKQMPLYSCILLKKVFVPVT